MCALCHCQPFVMHAIIVVLMTKGRVCYGKTSHPHFCQKFGGIYSAEREFGKRPRYYGQRGYAEGEPPAQKNPKADGQQLQGRGFSEKETEYEDLILLVEGRADGILSEEKEIVIDEIKGIYGDPKLLTQPVPVHRAQAMCYARIYAEMEQIEEIGIQMTYANLDTEEIRRFREGISYQELEEWYQKLLEAYHKWVSYQLAWKKRRNASMEGLEFPFPYREGQRKMVTSVYHTILAGKQIFIQAPTGVGKTMSTVFPAVRAVGGEEERRFLSYCEDDYKDCCGGSIRYFAAGRSFV